MPQDSHPSGWKEALKVIEHRKSWVASFHDSLVAQYDLGVPTGRDMIVW